MDLSLIYSKTGKGARALLSKNKSLSSHCLLVLSRINGKASAESIMADTQLAEKKFVQALRQLLDDAYIQVVQDFMPSVFDLNSAIEVAEISTEEFFNLGLPDESEQKTEEQLAAEARAKAYAEEQSRKEAKEREQQEAERKLLLVTDILAKSGDRIDIEKLATDQPASPAPQSKQSPSDPEPTTIPDSRSTKKPPAPIDNTKSFSGTSENLDSTSGKMEARPAEAQSATKEPARHKASLAAQQLAAEERPRLDARQKTEERARVEAEERARVEAEERARVEAERRQKALEQARLKAEEKARKAEEKARREEERRALKERLQLEKLARKQARAEAKAQARVAAEAKARADAEQRAKEKAERQARIEADAQIRAAEKAKAREEAQAREAIVAAQRAQSREQARLEAEARAVLKAEERARKQAELRVLSTSWLRGFIKVTKPLLVVSSLSLVLLVFLIPFISFGIWTESVEKIVADTIGEPVNIQDVHVALWPRPHLILDNISVGQLADISARSAYIYPALSALFADDLQLSGLSLEGLTLDNSALTRPLNWVAFAARQQHAQLENISLTNAVVRMAQVELPAVNADIELKNDNQLKEATIYAEGMEIEIQPVGDSYEVELTAQQWQPPMGPPVTFDELRAEGRADHSGLTITSLEGVLYGGKLMATSSIRWGSGWSMSGNMELANIDLGQAVPAVSQRTRLLGRLSADGAYNATADQLEALPEKSSIDLNFAITHGEIGGLDLARAASGRQQAVGTTRFDQLTGHWELRDNQYRLTQLQLKAGSLTAKGELSVSANHEIAGVLQTRMDLSSRRLQDRFTLAGTLPTVGVRR